MTSEDQNYLLVQVTTRNKQQAELIAESVIKKHLVACAQYFPIHSVFEWKHKISEDNEYLILMKTRSIFYKNLETYIKKIHSYEIPEILAFPITSGSKSYLNWINKVTK